MLIEILSTPSRRLRAISMTAAQEGQVIPFASADTLFTCANACVPTASINRASNQICVRCLISEFL
jgi:hypothetical protein